MTKGYIYAEITIHNPEEYKKYANVARRSIDEYGGKYLIRGADGYAEVLEGERPAERTILLEFPSREQAAAWYSSEHYREPKGIRQRAATTQLILLTGFDGAMHEVQRVPGT